MAAMSMSGSTTASGHRGDEPGPALAAAVLALSANSPFWLGLDTGFASYRTELFGRFPMTGIPPTSPPGPSSTSWSRT